MSGAIAQLDAKLAGDQRTVAAPRRASFAEFLTEDARVPVGEGRHVSYHFKGREALREVVATIDTILGSNGGEPLQDSSLRLAGGAQFGKTILELNLAAYLTSQRFLNFGLYLPDDTLADGVIDTKFRPDVVDQIPWFARMTQVGRAVTNSGKSVNSKRAATITDGDRRANFMCAGLKKVPTTFSFDVVARDEEDDINPRMARFSKGRMGASNFRIEFVIGTQRVHGRGQNQAWKDGSQGVLYIGPASEAAQPATVDEIPAGWVNPEESFPGIIRMQIGEEPSAADPKLTWAGDFRRDEEPNTTVATHKPGNRYYFAHPDTGAPLDRNAPAWLHRRPERIELRKWSFRISQLGIAAISLSKIVNEFTDERDGAVNNPEAMVVFRCDVLAMPQSMAQALDPAIIARARDVEPYESRLRLETGRAGFAGLDVGDKCWLWTNERESDSRRRLIHASSFTAADMVARASSLFFQMGLSALFVDQRPLVSQARELAALLNGLGNVQRWPEADESKWLSLPGGLTWNPDKKRWTGLRCAVVRFDKKQIGQGIEHAFDIYEEAGVQKFVPLIRCNREETIDRAVRGFLTPNEGVNEVLPVIGVRSLPSQLLPVKRGSMDEIVEAHLIAGSERTKDAKSGDLADYVDGVANHELLACGYSLLAETECGKRNAAPAGIIQSILGSRRFGILNRRGGRAL